MTIVPALDLRSAEPHPQHAPSNIEAEQALLGAILFDNAAYERLSDQLQLDSMDFLDIVMELRKRHSIEVPEADYIQLASLDSCAEYLTPKFNALSAKS